MNSEAVTIKVGEVIKIRKINIYESPILTVTRNNKTCHIVLDTGATASLISLAKVQQLNLKIFPTVHKAIQVDGVTDLKILGEVHTEFARGNLVLNFSGLVVNKLGTDILGGTNFHKENDVYSRMSKDMIVIKGTNIFQSTPVEVMTMDKDTSVPRLISIRRTQFLIPGDKIELELPTTCSPGGFYVVEPKLGQGSILCHPQVVKAVNGKIVIDIYDDKTCTPIKVTKNSKPIQVRETTTTLTDDGEELITKRGIDHEKLINKNVMKTKPFDEILEEIEIDQAKSMNPNEKKSFINTLKEFAVVLNPDLPGYNNYFGPVYASIDFASRARPPPHKTRLPSYGDHGQRLFQKKVLTMVQKGVLIDPYELGIQPRLVNDAWVVKKQCAAHLSWEECQEKDVRMVTGFDPLNKFLSQIPSKASDPMKIYSSLASWKHLGELDFADMYWQLKFKLETMRDKKQLEYLCIRTIGGVLAYARGPNGLLGMDAITDELTDRLLGDMILEGKVVKLADNVYFGGESVQQLHQTFHEIMRRCALADLRIKPSKIHMNIGAADILGLHWNKGTLSPSVHKLDPLAHCEKPKTVKGLRSFLGGVRFNEVCLNSRDLANATELLDELTPATREGKEEIVWTERLDEAFKKVQEVCQNPLTISVPRKGDHLFLAGDAAPSKGPGLGTKLFIQRPGVSGLLPSFNHGIRMKANMESWSACEVEAFQLSQAIKKFKPFLRFVGTKSTALIDSRAAVLAINRLENGQPSTSKRLQDLLTNISAENVRVSHISAKLPSPILEYVDFASRNPIECCLEKCTIHKEAETPYITFFGEAKVNAVDGVELETIPKVSVPIWKDIQTSSRDLKRVAALLESGKVPHKKEKRANDVRRYLRACTLNKDGLVVAKQDNKSQPFLIRKQDRIVIPREFAYTFATVLHRKFNHPLPTQMLKQFNRSFFMLDALEVIQKVTRRCEYPCEAMKKVPKETMEYHTETKPEVAGVYFNADVLKESCQNVFVLRENLTSYTETKIIKNEQKNTMREAIIQLVSKLRGSQNVVVRVDAQSSLKALKNDRILKEEKIELEIGSSKNKQKNSVAEKAIRELREEMVKVSPRGGKISETQLAKATMNLNFRIRHTGHSARELWVKRDQNLGHGLEFEDEKISDLQYKMRVDSHDSSARYESRNAKKVILPELKIGDKIFIKSDGCKSKARDPYLILAFVPNKNEIEVQKLLDKNRKNVIRVHLQNVYKAQTDDTDEESKQTTYNFDDIEVPNEDDKRSPPKQIRKERRLDKNKDEKCFFCIRMRRKHVHHSHRTCLSLLKVRPQQNQATMNMDDSSESSEAECEVERRLILFSDDEDEEVELEETVYSVKSHEESLLDMAIDDVELLRLNNDETNEDAESKNSEEVVNSDTTSLDLSKNDQNSDLEENKDSSDDVIKDSVIQHSRNGKCCAEMPTPRPRLDARSLPGRSIENRNLSVEVQQRLGARRKTLPGRLVKEGEVIRYFTGYSGDVQQWLRATVQPMTLTQQRKHPAYYNILNEKGNELSIELLPGERTWQVLH